MVSESPIWQLRHVGKGPDVFAKPRQSLPRAPSLARPHLAALQHSQGVGLQLLASRHELERLRADVRRPDLRRPLLELVELVQRPLELSDALTDGHVLRERVDVAEERVRRGAVRPDAGVERVETLRLGAGLVPDRFLERVRLQHDALRRERGHEGSERVTRTHAHTRTHTHTHTHTRVSASSMMPCGEREDMKVLNASHGCTHAHTHTYTHTHFMSSAGHHAGGRYSCVCVCVCVHVGVCV